MDHNKIVISAFPGVGKTYFKQHYADGTKVLDSDSSQYSWIVLDDGTKERNPDFPENYITHIKQSLDNPEINVILVSSHQDVRQALYLNGIHYYLVYPAVELKQQYMKRFQERGSPKQFIQIISNNWQNWIQKMDLQFLLGFCQKVKITQPNVYLKDMFKQNK